MPPTTDLSNPPLEGPTGSKPTSKSDATAPIVGDHHARPIRIEPSSGLVPLKLDDLWEYRELLYFLTWRDVKVRYKQTLLGAAWAIIQPVMMMVVFSLAFGRMAKMPSDGIPYPIFSYAALVPWTFFSSSITFASASLVGGSNLLKKIFFPRLTMPIAAVLGCLVDFFLAFTVLLGMMAFYRMTPTVNVLWLPLFLLLALITALGVGLWLSALNVKYRDIRYVVPFMVQLWLFASPVVYSSSMLPSDKAWLKTLYGINPMAGVVEGFRWALLGTPTGPGPMLLVSSLVAFALLVSGAYYFRQMERTFADIV